MRGRFVAVLLVAGCLLLTAHPARAQEATGVAVINFTRFAPVAQDVVIPAGGSARFNVDARNYGRVSLLIAGETRPGAGPIAVQTLFGPPHVPGGTPHPLPVNDNGQIAVSFVEPVRGPSMVIVVRNDSAADARLTISAYLAI
jgi:hypothetical protein